MSFLQFSLFPLILIALKFIVCAETLVAERLQGGDITEHSKFPYQVRIVSSKLGICGGSILDDYHVISAAHCFIDRKLKKWGNDSYIVVAGATDFKGANRSEWVSASVEKVYVPKLYWESIQNNDPTRRGDIAVMKLESSLNLEKNSHLKAVQLPKNTDLTFSNETAVVSGYGNNQVRLLLNKINGGHTWTGSSDGKLRFANARVLTNSECQSKWDSFTEPQKRRRKNITERHICSQVYQRDVSNPEGVCGGDSGGPLVFNGSVLIGIVNSGLTKCEETNVPTIYARVSSYEHFIHNAWHDVSDPEILTNNIPIFRWNKIKFDSIDNLV